MGTVDIARCALPLRVTRCELVDYNLNFAGPQWYLNATCEYRFEWKGRIYTEESDPEGLRALAGAAIGASLVAIEANMDMDDPGFVFDNGMRVSLSADPEDPYEPWTMRVPDIVLTGSTVAEIEHGKNRNLDHAPGSLEHLGEVVRTQSFPPGWSMEGRGWSILVACPWQRESGASADGLVVPDDYLGRRLELLEYEKYRCTLSFDDGSRILISSDGGRRPWFVRRGRHDTVIVGRPRMCD